MLCLGYHGVNHTLRDKHILTDRTARQETIRKLGSQGIPYLQSLYHKNLADLYQVMLWNVKHRIRFYRISSGIAPHITDPEFIPARSRSDCRALVYPLDSARKLLREIGRLARENRIRLTFHPGQHTVLSTGNEELFIRSARDLYYHARIFDLMELDYNSVLIVHGGGVYGDKPAAIKRWIENFRRLPLNVRRRLVIENDEKSYSLEDVLYISKYTGVPVVFDIFHYYLYNQTLARRRLGGEVLLDQRELEYLLPKVIRSWGSRRVKMHISEQRRGGVFGEHAQYVRTIPPLLLNLPRKIGRDIDLMIEAKSNEAAVLYLRRKYGNRVC
jgi:UV DNA damage endonuclease